MAPDKHKTNMDRQIDENLKRVYDDAMSEDVPDKFLDLIAQLRAKDSGGTAQNGK